MKSSKQVLVLLVCCSLVGFTAQAESLGPTSQSNEQPSAPPVQHSPQELQQLVAPIALYPDALIAQVLAASTYPTQIVEAERWMQNHSNLKGEELAKEVDKQDLDPSVKALAQFPSVLENMDKNLSWTSSLGEAYVTQPQDVTDAVQALRQQASKSGHAGFRHGDFGHGHGDFGHGGDFNHGNAFHGGRPGGGGSGFHGSSAPHFQPGTRSGAFSGFDHGGNVRGFSTRGRSSFGGGSHGGGFHGGGGGRHR